jgi:hypothetical protein
MKIIQLAISFALWLTFIMAVAQMQCFYFIFKKEFLIIKQ